MTQAYIEGFCKAAEAYGVDPAQLVKAAQGIPLSAYLHSAGSGGLIGLLPGLAAGGLSHVYDGDRKRNALLGAAAGGLAGGAFIAPGALETRKRIKELEAFVGQKMPLGQKARLMSLFAALPLGAAAAGGLAGSLLGKKKKKSLWDKIKSKLGK
jgi:hypothetical protein